MDNLDRLSRPRRAKPTLRPRADTSLRLLLDGLVKERMCEGMTQQYVASRMVTTASAISRLESGQLSISVRPKPRYFDEDAEVS